MNQTGAKSLLLALWLPICNSYVTDLVQNTFKNGLKGAGATVTFKSHFEYIIETL